MGTNLWRVVIEFFMRFCREVINMVKGWRPALVEGAMALLLLGGIVSGCSKGEIIVKEPEQGQPGQTGQVRLPISLTPTVQTTRSNSLINDATTLQSYAISLLGIATVASSNSAIFRNDALNYTESTWSYGTTPQYWIPTGIYKFAAFAPYASPSTAVVGANLPADGKNKLSNGTVSYTEENSIPTLTITGYNTGRVTTGESTFDARSEDLLFAYVMRDNSNASDYSAVPLQMNHILSCLEFNVRNATNMDITSLNNISFGGHLYKCSINVSSNVPGVQIENIPLVVTEEEIEGGTQDVTEDSSIYFTGDDRTGDTETPYLPKGMSETNFKPLFDCNTLTVLPQDVYEKDITLKFTVHFGVEDTEGTEYSVDLSSIESVTRWSAGKKYTYNLTISSSNIIFQVVEVPWVEHNVEL